MLNMENEGGLSICLPCLAICALHFAISFLTVSVFTSKAVHYGPLKDV